VYNLKVHDLLLPNSKQWDVAKINSLFPLEVAHNILDVPLLELVREDRLVWSEENNGVYSVRSGYRKLMKEKNSGHGQQGGDGWRNIWRLHAPPKAKHLFWRICRGVLPTRTRLRNRYVQCPEECPLCLNHVEDDCHLFFNCEAVQEAWIVMGLSQVIQSRRHVFTEARELIFDICRTETNSNASKAAVLVWIIWQIRNNKVWNDGNTSAVQAGMQAAAYWQQWASVNDVFQEQTQPRQQRSSSSHVMQWQQPPVGVLKCNVDASFFAANGATGWGWCLRNFRGQFQLAGTNIVHSYYSVVEGEALAVIEAMEEMILRGFRNVIFESDSKLVVDAISSTHNGISEFSTLITHIQSLLRSHNYFEVKYVKRQANNVAHTLARAAYSMSSRRVYDSIPRCIDTILNNEMY
jgi:ribonuclease HI